MVVNASPRDQQQHAGPANNLTTYPPYPPHLTSLHLPTSTVNPTTTTFTNHTPTPTPSPMASPHHHHNPYVPPFLPPPPSPIPSFATPTPPTPFMPFSPPPGTSYHASPPFSSSPSYPHPGYHPPPPEHPQNFSPFFTLISNPGSTVYKHPIVHYVFSDDDFDPVTETTLAAAEEAIATPTTGSGSGRQGSGQGRRQQPPKDRVVIVDVGNDGETVVAAHSLSKEWQIVGVGISSAPQWMAPAASSEDPLGAGGAAPTGQGGLMLTVEGTERIGLRGVPKTENLYELAEVFSERCVVCVFMRGCDFDWLTALQDGSDQARHRLRRKECCQFLSPMFLSWRFLSLLWARLQLSYR